MKNKTTRMIASHCPNCKEELTGATCVEGGHSPQPGDITICAYCHHLLAFDYGLHLRELTREEQIEVAGDKRILDAMARPLWPKQAKGRMEEIIA